MKARAIVRYVVGFGTLVALLAGCGGLRQAQDDVQLPIGTQGMTPRGGAIRTHDDLGGSRMLSDAKSNDLLYAADGTNTYFVSYPGGVPVGELANVSGRGICSDSTGDVFIIQSDRIIEYAHGGDTPINTLSIPGGNSCASDPITGNLAVADGPEILVFLNATGTPRTYMESGVDFKYCAYDNNGNLFITSPNPQHGSQPSYLFELPSGKSDFTTIALNKELYYLADLAWDGKYVAIDSFAGQRAHKIYRVKVSGSTGTVVGTVSLKRPGGLFADGTWLQGHTFISPVWFDGKAKRVYFWSYPSGGRPSKMLPRGDFPAKGPIWAVTVSVAPSR